MGGVWVGRVMDGGTARPDVKRRVTRAAPLTRQEPVLPTDGSCCMSLLVVLSVPWDYVPSSWFVEDGWCYGTTMGCGVLEYWARARSW